MKDIFVIACWIPAQAGSKQYYAIDHQSGGYPYWDDRLFSAKTFNSIEDAKKVLENDEFVRKQITTDGTIYPPSMVQSGANINFKKPKGELKVRIEKIKTVDCQLAVTFKGEIKKPRGFTY